MLDFQEILQGLRNVKPKPGKRHSFIIEQLIQPIAPLCVLCLSLGLTSIAWYYAAKAVKRDAQINFERQVSESTNALNFRLQTYINFLRASQALFTASQSVERDEWKVFAESLNLQTIYPGINGVGFIRYVPNSRKASYERRVRLDTSVAPKGYPDFAIKPAGDRRAYFVIEYIEPLAPNRLAMGLDVGGDPVRRAAVIRARDTGAPAATGKIVLVQDATQKPGFLILLPVYRHDLPQNTVEEKRRALLGFVYAPLRTTSLIEKALSNVLKQDLSLKVYNGKDLMYASERVQQGKNSNAFGRMHQTTALDVAGETWQLYFTSQRASGAFWAPKPMLVLAGGTVISLLLVGIVRSLTSSRRRALQMATSMTADLRTRENLLRQSEERYRAIVEDQTELIARFDLDGRLTFVNQAYCRYFGKAQEQLIGTSFYCLVVPEDLEKLTRHLDSLILNNPIATIENRVVVNEQVRYLQWSNRIIFDEKGNFLEFQSVGQDISARLRTEAALRDSERRFRAIFNSMFQFIGLLKPDGTLLEANQTALDFAGVSADEVIGHPFWEARWWTISPEIQQQLKEAIASAASGEFVRYEVELLGAGDTVATIDFSLKPVKDEAGKVVLLIPEGRDLSARKQTERALQESESTLRSFFDSAAMMMGIVEVFDDDILHISDNAATAKFFGSTPEAMRGQFATQMGVPQQHLHEWLARYRESELSNNPVRFEYSHNTATGSAWLAATVCEIAPMPNGRSRFSYIVEDITDRKRSQKQIAASLTEKEVLLKEIHHRVKNNLQVICSLLNLQARSLKDATTTALFKETQNRVRSMALVHEKLYQSNNLSKIELGEYLRDLANNLSRSYPIDNSNVIFKIDIQSNIFLTIDTAVPCGLIVNELISNALKYAFKPGEKGEISLQAWLNEEQNLGLTVQDNGKGFPANFNLENSQTLGLKLVKTLTNQLRGNLELDNSSGTKFKILLTQINH